MVISNVFSKTETQLGPSSSLDCRGGFYPVEVLHQPLGSKAGQHALASSSKQQQAGGPKVLATTPWLKNGIQVAEIHQRTTLHDHQQLSCILSHLACSIASFWLFSRRSS